MVFQLGKIKTFLLGFVVVGLLSLSSIYLYQNNYLVPLEQLTYRFKTSRGYKDSVKADIMVDEKKGREQFCNLEEFKQKLGDMVYKQPKISDTDDAYWWTLQGVLSAKSETIDKRLIYKIEDNGKSLSVPVFYKTDFIDQQTGKDLEETKVNVGDKVFLYIRIDCSEKPTFAPKLYLDTVIKRYD